MTSTPNNKQHRTTTKPAKKPAAFVVAHVQGVMPLNNEELMDRITEKDKFQELLSNIRHYSTLRFAMLTVFVAINGGLLSQFFNCVFAQNNPDAIQLFQWGGAILAIFFFTYERALDHNLSNYWDTVKHQVGQHDSFISNRGWLYKTAVPIATHGVSVLALVFWVFFAENYYPCVK